MIATLAGVKLADCRKRQALTQYQLAVKAGIAPATVSSIERGKHQARLTVIRRLSDALGVEPSDVDEFRPSLGLPPTG